MSKSESEGHGMWYGYEVQHALHQRSLKTEHWTIRETVVLLLLYESCLASGYMMLHHIVLSCSALHYMTMRCTVHRHSIVLCNSMDAMRCNMMTVKRMMTNL